MSQTLKLTCLAFVLAFLFPNKANADWEESCFFDSGLPDVIGCLAFVYDTIEDVYNELVVNDGNLGDIWSNIQDIFDSVYEAGTGGVLEVTKNVKNVTDTMLDELNKLENLAAYIPQMTANSLAMLEYADDKMFQFDFNPNTDCATGTPCDQTRQAFMTTIDSLDTVLNTTLVLQREVANQGLDNLAQDVDLPEIQVDLVLLRSLIADAPPILIYQLDQLMGEQIRPLLAALNSALETMVDTELDLFETLGFDAPELNASHLLADRGVHKFKPESITYYAVGCNKLLEEDTSANIRIAVTVMDVVAVVASAVASGLEAIDGLFGCCDISAAASVGAEAGVSLGIHPVAFLSSVIGGASDLVSAVGQDMLSAVDQCSSEYLASTSTCYQEITMCMLEPGMQSAARNQDLRAFCWGQVTGTERYTYCPQPEPLSSK